MRVATRPQSTSSDRVWRPTATAHSTGFHRATAAIQPGRDSVGTSIEDRKDSGSTTKLTAPITDSWLRSSSARALEYDAKAAPSSTTQPANTSITAGPPGNRAPVASPSPRITTVWTTVVTCW